MRTFTKEIMKISSILIYSANEITFRQFRLLSAYSVNVPSLLPEHLISYVQRQPLAPCQ